MSWFMTPAGVRVPASIAAAAVTGFIGAARSLSSGQIATPSVPVTSGSPKPTVDLKLVADFSQFQESALNLHAELLNLRIQEEDRRLWAMMREILEAGMWPYKPQSMSIWYEDDYVDYGYRKFSLELDFGDWRFLAQHRIRRSSLDYYEPFEYAIELADVAVAQWRSRPPTPVPSNVVLGEY